MDALRHLLANSEPLLLFLVIGIGYLVGQIRVRGFGLGVAAVLFVGLAFGAWREEDAPPLAIARELIEVGLILFVYAVGLTSGPGFFDAFKKRGLRFNLAVLGGLVAGTIITILVGRALGLGNAMIAGVYCGGLTNTPALAAVTELLKSTAPDSAADPTLGYSVAYPFGILGGLVAFILFARIERARFDEEKAAAAAHSEGARKVVACNFKITNPEIDDKAIGELEIQERVGVVISRQRHNGEVFVPTKYTRLRLGDVIVAVGTKEKIDAARAYFGEESSERLEANREQIEMRRILLSNRALVGRPIEDLDLERRFNAQVTRLRRADIDIVPTPDMTLEIGDRLRVVMPRDRSAEVSKFFGDSERDIAELDYTALTLGISLGVLIGMIPIPIPGIGTVALGFAGGPLLVALVLGRMGRTGKLVWSIPLESNHALRHIGLLIFLAGVGVKAGSGFGAAMASAGWKLFLLGIVTTTLTTGLTMLLLRRAAGGTVIGTMGATSGMQTQPATLARAHEMSRSDEVYVAYATTYPVAMIGKIILAQLIVLLA